MSPDLVAEFERIYRRQPEAGWTAPGRVNLIGEYMDVNESFVLPIAIRQATRVMAAPRSDRALGLYSAQFAADGRAPVVAALDGGAMPQGWPAYPVAVALALEAAGHTVGGADLLVDSDVPVGSGLSSSAALECSVATALCTLSGVDLPPMEMARLARRAENEFVGVPCGIMDQAASMCSRDAHALLLDTRSLEVVHVPFDLEAAGLGLLVVDTRVKHEHGSSGYSRRQEACDAAARALGVRALRDVPPEHAEASLQRLKGLWDGEVEKRARHVFSEQARVLQAARCLQAGDVAALGPVLLAGHASLRDDFQVSCAELDTVVDTAAGAGAIGARMTGGGFGGSAIVLGDNDRLGDVEMAIRKAFAESGFAPPNCFLVSASPGARRLL